MALAIVEHARARNENTHSRRLERHRRLGRIAEAANQLAHAATLVMHRAEEADAQGGRLVAAEQMNFLVGAMMRLVKDVGVVEHLQSLDVAEGKPSK